MRALIAAVVVAAALAVPAAASAEDLTIAASDGAKLACTLGEPAGSPPAAGWAAVMLFHGLGGKRQDLVGLANQLAAAGYASLACDARGHGTSEGLFGLDGPRDVQDTRELFTWLTARPEISDTQIGALGFSLGGGAVWNATTAGVPFKAIVPIITWTNLTAALAPQGLSKSGLVTYLSQLVPQSRWDPELLAAAGSLVNSTNLAAVTSLAASRSPLAKLGSVRTPTLLLQGRRDFLFDVNQALDAYKLLKGPKRLYVGDFGHAPGVSPASSPDAALWGSLALRWFDRFLKGAANGIDKKVVELGHDPYDGKVTTYTTTPATKTISVLLPGTTTLSGANGKAARGVRVTGGPHETFGVSSVTVPYSNAKTWDHLVAVLAVGKTPITAGGVKVTGASGTATIKFMNQALRVGSGQKLTVYLASTSLAQSPSNALYLAAVQPGSEITLGRATLKLSVLKKAVSR